MVYLVGAGPGDPGLITVRGLHLVQQADVVVYDRLVHPDLVAHARPSAECVFVGKAPGRHTLPQDEINALLVREARRRRAVVRLKGGDPYVFGRGGEEGQYLAEAGVPFEVVPGITSALAAPAYAGIPVTNRDVATSFTVVTGHTSDLSIPDPAWAALPQAGTLVILMGLGRLPEIARRLIDHGRPPDTPVAVIRSGTNADQEVVTGTLATIGDRAAHLRPPATIVVGPVVELREALDWFSPAGEAGEVFPAALSVPASTF
jgi:uroporphyrin-III C-methyltransferase